ncbi:MAG: dihydropteroate synthase [Bacteroidales bacterium]
MERHRLINLGGRLMDCTRPLVMGVINITPDSFYQDSRHDSVSRVLETVARMVEEKADIIDVGGYSTRPGADEVPVKDELERVIGALTSIRKEFPELVLSVDTFRSSVAKAARSEAGVDIINDISGGMLDDNMFKLVATLNIPYVMMHMQGTPATMQKKPVYNDVVSDIIEWFGKRISLLEEAGVRDIIVDPGIGFGKTTEQNYEIIGRLAEFEVVSRPLMAGVSRKSLIWKTLGTTPGEALNGTTALNMALLINGAAILRVHDVREAVETVSLYHKISGSGL